MFKKWLLLFLLIPGYINAQFQLKIKVNNISDSVAYLRSTIFDEKNYIPKDTLDLRKKTVIYRNIKSIVGGIYFIYFPSTKQKISFILEDNDTTVLEIEGSNYLNTAKINKTKNQLLLNYQRLEYTLAHYDSSYATELKLGKKFGQAQKAAYFKIKTDSLVAFRTNALKLLKPKDALYIYFKTLNTLDASIPNKKEYTLRNNFIKQFDFKEPKLLFTPAMRLILVEYAAYYPLVADSLIKALDSVMQNLTCTDKAYPFVFDYFAKLFKNRDVQNNTEGYSYIIKKYVKEGKCTFLEPRVKESMLNELSQLQLQKIKDTCVNLILDDTTGEQQDLHLFAHKNNYTVIIFYDPSCEHCKVEVPKMDSIINVLERQLLVKIGKYAICNSTNIAASDWKRFIHQFHLENNYIHVLMGNEYNYRKAYDAFSNPLFYLVDKDGVLLAKKLSTNTLRKELVSAFEHFK